VSDCALVMIDKQLRLSLQFGELLEVINFGVLPKRAREGANTEHGFPTGTVVARRLGATFR
jgi:hypothetical protein